MQTQSILFVIALQKMRGKMFSRFLQDESGATAIEYGLIAALIAVGIIAGATAIGDQVNNSFDNVAGEVGDASSGENLNQANNKIP